MDTKRTRVVATAVIAGLCAFGGACQPPTAPTPTTNPPTTAAPTTTPPTTTPPTTTPPTTTPPASPADRLNPGQVLGSGQQLTAADGRAVLRMQPDGNLVLIHPGNAVVWSSSTFNNPGSVAVMQNDGNLVVVAPGNQPKWSSGTAGHHGASLRVQNDGNLVLYASGNVAVWSTQSPYPPPAAPAVPVDQWRMAPGRVLGPGQFLASPDGRHVLLMQTDGNAVLIASGNQPIWSTNTSGNPGSVLVMQGDGNLVVVAPGNVAKWSSSTFGRPGSVLALQNDGNLVIYAPGNVAIWSMRGQGAGSAVRNRIVEIAHSQVGVRESSPNFIPGDPYGNNSRGPVNGSWCSDFVSWVWQRAGVNMPTYPFSGDVYRWAQRSTVVRPAAATPKVGDAVLRGTGPASVGTSTHIAIVVAVRDDGAIQTIGGNEGDAVRLSAWHRPTGHYGFASPVGD